MSNSPTTNETTQQFFERIVAASRDRKPPSARNRQIADQVQVNGRTQAEVAAEYGLSQRRISQICQQVDRWNSEKEAWQRGEAGGKAQQESENELMRRQFTEIYRRSMRAHARSEQALLTRRRRMVAGQEEWSEETEREQRQDTGSLRVAMRALEQMKKLEPRGAVKIGFSEREAEDCFGWAMGQLVQLRGRAEQRGELPRSAEGPQALVERLLREMLGDGEATRAGEAPREGEAPAEPQTLPGKPAVAPEPDAASHSVASHPDGSSSTSAPCSVEAAMEGPAGDSESHASDDGAVSYAAAESGAAAPEADEKFSIRSRAGGAPQPAKAAPDRDNPDPDDESPERVLDDLSRAYGIGMTWDRAEEELNEFMLNTYGSKNDRRWSYSAQQRTALEKWHRLTREPRRRRSSA